MNITKWIDTIPIKKLCLTVRKLKSKWVSLNFKWDIILIQQLLDNNRITFLSKNWILTVFKSYLNRIQFLILVGWIFNSFSISNYGWIFHKVRHTIKLRDLILLFTGLSLNLIVLWILNCCLKSCRLLDIIWMMSFIWFILKLFISILLICLIKKINLIMSRI